MKYKKIIFCALSLLITAFSHSMRLESSTPDGLITIFYRQHDQQRIQQNEQQPSKKEEQAMPPLNYAELFRNSDAAQLALRIFANRHESPAPTNNDAPRPDYRPIPPTIEQSAPVAPHLLRPAVREIEKLREKDQQENYLYEEPCTLDGMYVSTKEEREQQNRAAIAGYGVNAARYRETMPTIASCYAGRTSHIISCIQE